MMAELAMLAIGEESGLDIVELDHLSTGHNAALYRATLRDRTNVAVKCTLSDKEDTLDTEAFMLEYLRKNSDLPVPEVVYSAPDMIILEYIEHDEGLNKSCEEHAAKLLAALHSIEGTSFGFERDTLIGPLHQPNPQTDDWISFFAEHRLIYMAKEALSEEKISSSLLGNIEKLTERLPDLLDNNIKPSLIHGDMWQGNILCKQGKIAGFVDPAIYYAHPEIELAFSTLFQTFKDTFFETYQEIRPLAPGFFEERKDLYNLYPLLVHARLYGENYAKDIEAIVKRFL